MKLKLSVLAVVSFCLVSGQHTAAGLLQTNKTEAVRQSTNDAASLPLTLRGIPSKQIMVGQQAKFLPDLALLDQDGRQDSPDRGDSRNPPDGHPVEHELAFRCSRGAPRIGTPRGQPRT